MKRKVKKLRKYHRQKRALARLGEVVERSLIVWNLENSKKATPLDLVLMMPRSKWIALMQYAMAMTADPNYEITVKYKGFRLKPEISVETSR